MIITLQNLDPVALQIGPVAIRWYSLAYIAGIIYLALWLSVRDKKDGVFLPCEKSGKKSGFGALNSDENLPKSKALKKSKSASDERKISQNLSKKAREDWMSWAVLGIIFGGRLGYVCFYNFGYFLHHPLEIFAIWQGGMSFHGGLLGVILAMWIFAKKYKINYLKMMDVVAVAAPFGLLCGRLANFVNMELYGRITDGDFGVIFPGAGELPRHPSQLYEAGLEGLLLLLLMNFLFFKTKIRKLDGALSGVFLLGYGLARAVVENFREPDAHLGFIFGEMTMGQLLCAPLILVGIGLIILSFLKKTKPHFILESKDSNQRKKLEK